MQGHAGKGQGSCSQVGGMYVVQVLYILMCLMCPYVIWVVWCVQCACMAWGCE